MKSRTGFVSNSSSSSFCLFGVVATQQELIKLLGDKLFREPGCDHQFDRSTKKF